MVRSGEGGEREKGKGFYFLGKGGACAHGISFAEIRRDLEGGLG
jgi:hypothetical protein